jgi:hypothetical protein
MFPRYPVSRIHRFFTYDALGQLLPITVRPAACTIITTNSAT